MLRTFEDALFPEKLRWEYAHATWKSTQGKRVGGGHCDTNITKCDIACFNTTARLLMRSEIARMLYPKANTDPYETCCYVPMIGIMNLMVPVGCNASCPGICFTDIGNWKPDSAHLTPYELYEILEEFSLMGGKLIRIVGDGEPVLYKELPGLCRWARCFGKNVIVFTNGLTIPEPVIHEYEKGSLFFYIKLWSEDAETQNRLVTPKRPYKYTDGPLGNAPDVFYQLHAIDPERVGFQVMVSKLNEADARRIISGPKTKVPLFIEAFIPEGAGRDHRELIVQGFSYTKSCEQPPRGSYLAVINSKGELQAGTFVSEGAVCVKGGKLKRTWGNIFTSSELFFKARYDSGCFCEQMRS